MSSSRPVLSRAEADLVAELARTFMDPVTGELPAIAVRRWAASDACGRCGDWSDAHLYAYVDGTVYCVRCWNAAGQPWP